MTIEEIIKILGITKTKEYMENITEETYFNFPVMPFIEAEKHLSDEENRSIAYFSMEFGLATTIYNRFKSNMEIDKRNYLSHHEVFSNIRAMDYYHVLPFDKLLDLPIYSGGLGVLAGDCLKSAADKKLSMVGVGILWNKGYFHQKLWFKYGQIDEEINWEPLTYPGLIRTNKKVVIQYGGEDVWLNIWKYPVYSHDKRHVVILLLLDSNTEENSSNAKQITDQLYRSDDISWKISQRIVLGVGGMKALDEMGYKINKYHLNEGHAAFAFVEKALKDNNRSVEKLKERFTYTCHTPVEAGHDKFSFDVIRRSFGEKSCRVIEEYGRDPHNHNIANLTYMAMNTSARVNAVAKKHGEITKIQFPNHKQNIQTVTNGIHTYTWVSDSFAELFDKYKSELGDWHDDPKALKNVLRLMDNKDFRSDVWDAHCKNKALLADFFRSWFFEKDTFTLAWARRIAPYKRPTLIFYDPERLIQVAKKVGPMQIIIAGKAHPNDDRVAQYIHEIMDKIDELGHCRDIIKVVLLENYNTYIGKILTSHVDVWLNNPLPPFEASGTSGMKAILNGVVQLSTLDGWVVEAADKNIGKIFGYRVPDGLIGNENDFRFKEDSRELYNCLEGLAKEYYRTERDERQGEKSEWINKMITCVSEGAFFSTHRMVEDYKNKIWG